jgi:hypothetical protein
VSGLIAVSAGGPIPGMRSPLPPMRMLEEYSPAEMDPEKEYKAGFTYAYPWQHGVDGRMQCKFCKSVAIVKNGSRANSRSPNQRYVCSNCGRQFSRRKGKFSPSVMLRAVGT